MDDLTKSNRYDAIVVGSGISGGWAAMELCKRGLKTLLLERGRDVQHVTDYPTAFKRPWEFENRLENSLADIAQSPIQSSVFSEDDKHFFVNDTEHPYIQEKPFSWIRGYHVGGRSLTWGRQCYRWSDLDFEANVRDGIGIDWPIRYRELEPWYAYAESFIGVSGNCEYLSQLPDGHFLPPMDLNCIEQHLAASLKRNYEKRVLTIARVANLTRGWKGRGPCMNRNLCRRGCPYGAYFSSNSATLPVAYETGNLTLRPFSIVTEVLYDAEKNRAKGVRIIDAVTSETLEFHSRIIFLNASTIATTGILLQSKSSRFPNGMGNDSDQLGRNLMDHHSTAGASGKHEGYQDSYYKGRRPAGFLIPRYRNLQENEQLDFVRGYNLQGHGERQEWVDKGEGLKGFGLDFKQKLLTPGPWTVWMAGWGECLPYADNRVSLAADQQDRWGQPLLSINFEYRENERLMRKDIRETAADMLEKAGFRDVQSFDYHEPPGGTVHEMGTARMGKDPKTSVLNRFNQVHAVKNVFVTDGSCMTSSACQNPSLTYMALTARACAFAVEEMKRQEL